MAIGNPPKIKQRRISNRHAHRSNSRITRRRNTVHTNTVQDIHVKQLETEQPTTIDSVDATMGKSTSDNTVAPAAKRRKYMTELQKLNAGISTEYSLPATIPRKCTTRINGNECAFASDDDDEPIATTVDQNHGENNAFNLYNNMVKQIL